MRICFVSFAEGVNHILNEGASKMSIPHGDILDTPSLILSIFTSE